MEIGFNTLLILIGSLDPIDPREIGWKCKCLELNEIHCTGLRCLYNDACVLGISEEADKKLMWADLYCWERPEDELGRCRPELWIHSTKCART